MRGCNCPKCNDFYVGTECIRCKPPEEAAFDATWFWAAPKGGTYHVIGAGGPSIISTPVGDIIVDDLDSITIDEID